MRLNCDAVVLPNGHYVCLNDLLFERHGLGPRFAQVHTILVNGIPLSYAALNLDGTPYDLITTQDSPRDLGSFEELCREGAGPLYTIGLAKAFGQMPEPQLMALALIKARNTKAFPADERAMHRIAKWAKQYQMRARWICKNRVEAFARDELDWEQMGM